MQPIFKDDFNEVLLDTNRGLARMTRTSAHYPSVAAAEASLHATTSALHGIARPHLGVLLDLRKGPMRNDPEFEAVAARYRFKFGEGFGRFAVLVRTAVGELQVSRYGRESHVAVAIFHDEAEALAHVLNREGAQPATR